MPVLETNVHREPSPGLVIVNVSAFNSGVSKLPLPAEASGFPFGMKISIITASLNRKKFIGAAIESVLAQNYPNFEHWIIDGGSSDGTLAFLKQYPHLKVLSEPDRGVYDAWNKGIARASGEVVGFLNTDDQYTPGTFWRCRRCLIGLRRSSSRVEARSIKGPDGASMSRCTGMLILGGIICP